MTVMNGRIVALVWSAVILCVDAPMCHAQRKSPAALKAEQARASNIQQAKERKLENERKQLFQNDLNAYFFRYVDGKYGVLHGEPVRLSALSGDVFQIPKQGMILLTRGTLSPVAVMDVDTEGLVDGARVSLQVVEDGVYEYVNTLRAKSTIKRYRMARAMTSAEFEAFVAAGHRFPECP